MNELSSPRLANSIALDGAEAGDIAPATRSLRIVLDAYNHDLSFGTGIATYSRNLAKALGALGHDVSWLYGRSGGRSADAVEDEVLFFDVADPPSRFRRLRRNLGLVRDKLIGPTAHAHSVHRSSMIVRNPREDDGLHIYNAQRLYELAHIRHARLDVFTPVTFDRDIDVLHLTSPLPVRARKARTVCTIHDLIPLRLPYTTLDDKREIVRRFRGVAAVSDLVLTVSEASRDDIVGLLDIDPAKVAVTYQTSDMSQLDADEARHHEGVLARYGLKPHDYVLFVGAIEPKKNLRLLIEAFLEIDASTELVIVGRKAWMWEKDLAEIETLYSERARRRLRFMNYLPRNDLRHLYAGAMFLAFPSIYEGFGLPVLEAMQCGCPVLTSDVSSLPEVGGDAAIYCDPYDRPDIRRKLERMLGDPALRRACSEKGLAQAERFSPERYVRRLREAYAQLGV